jgi:ubiquinone/menaquinone biosynthesis C-methylase UbiE
MKEFWEKQALEYGEDVAAVNFDPLEDRFASVLIEQLVPDGLCVADLGCGNGRTLFDLAPSRPRGIFVGYDYAENMVRVAENRRQTAALNNVRFCCFDASSATLPGDARNAFDIVIGKRILINIKGSPKRQALRNVFDMLRPGGMFIMIECFIEPLERINVIRAGLGLEQIVVRPFNEYLTQAFLQEVEAYFTMERFLDIGSLYYFISRVFNAYLSEGKPDYFAPINQLASKLVLSGIRPMQGYAPEVTYVLRRREQPPRVLGSGSSAPSARYS